MDKQMKLAVQEMVNGGNGVTVAQDGAIYQVGFAFSNNLVNKIKGVEGAKWDKEGGVWNVPEASAGQLVAAVADMRDFVRNNGVQVKEVEGGDRQVLFDFNKEMNQVIGAVNGAKFDAAARVWNVAANSKALLVQEGQSTSYLDLAVNKMRGIAIETEKDRAEIKQLAAASATALGMKTDLYFPQKDYSYSGPILNANGRFAAQLENSNAEKGRPGYVVIHEVADLGKAVFKGDELRIDYDEKGHASVRTIDVFKQQQEERKALAELAAQKVDGPTVLNASMKDGAKHNGTVIEVTNHFVLQHAGRNTFNIHGRDALGGAVVAKDQRLEITYKGGKGAVRDLDKAVEHGPGVGR